MIKIEDFVATRKSADVGTSEEQTLMEAFCDGEWELDPTTTRVHLYMTPDRSPYVIEERPDGFAWWFVHPWILVQPTIGAAEELLVHQLNAEMGIHFDTVEVA